MKRLTDTVDYIPISMTVHLQRLKGVQISKLGMRVYNLSIEGIRKGLDLWAEPPRINIC